MWGTVFNLETSIRTLKIFLRQKNFTFFIRCHLNLGSVSWDEGRTGEVPLFWERCPGLFLSTKLSSSSCLLTFFSSLCFWSCLGYFSDAGIYLLSGLFIFQSGLLGHFFISAFSVLANSLHWSSHQLFSFSRLAPLTWFISSSLSFLVLNCSLNSAGISGDEQFRISLSITVPQNDSALVNVPVFKSSKEKFQKINF